MTRHLTKRGRVWHYRFKVGGREYTGTTEATDLATAKIVLEQVRRDTILGDHGIKKAPSLQAVAEEWMDTRGRAVSPSHLRAARQSFDALAPLHRLPLTHITTVRVDDWRATYLHWRTHGRIRQVLRGGAEGWRG